MPVKGRGEFFIQIGDHRIVHDIWVAEITDNCILGLDFLEANNSQIDIGGGCITIGDEITLNKVANLGEVHAESQSDFARNSYSTSKMRSDNSSFTL